MSGFDWNGNGNRDAFDSYMDMEIMSDTSSSSDDGLSDYDTSDDFFSDRNDLPEYIDTTFLKEEADKYSWRENYDYDFEHNIDPEEYETEEEYLEALEEAQIDSASVFHKSNVKSNSLYKVGQTIFHHSFGVGNIIAVKPIGNEYLLNINFQDIGIKQIFTRYARLTTNPIEINKNKQNNKQHTYIFFEDDNIRISFVKWERNCYLVGGYAKAGTFIFENKSNKRLYITMKNVSVGGFLNREEVPSTILTEGQKEMKSFPFVYENKVPDEIKKNETVEFKVYYGVLRDGYSSKANIIEPTIESDIISIPL